MRRSALLIFAVLLFVGCETATSKRVVIPTPKVQYSDTPARDEFGFGPEAAHKRLAAHPPIRTKAIPGARLNIGIGTSANDGTGDPLRTSFGKANTNFIELYANLTIVSNLANGGSANAKLNTNQGTAFGLTIGDVTASRAAAFGAQNNLTNADTTLAELNFVHGLTSAVQTQLDTKASQANLTTVSNSVVTDIANLTTVSNTVNGKLAIASNLSDLNNTATARSNLGVAIGSNVEAWDADLDAISAIASTGILLRSAANTWSVGSLSGDVTTGGANLVATIATGAVTSGKILDGTIATIDVANDAIDNTKLANMATKRFKARTTAGTGDPEDLTTIQAGALLQLPINGLDYMVGDGATDDTTALGTALAAVGSNGILDLNGKTYLISTKSISKSDFTIRNGTFKESSTNANFILLTGNNITWDNVNIDGQNMAFVGLFLNNASKEIKILNSTFKNIYGDANVAAGGTVTGIEVRRGSRKIDIGNCLFTNITHQVDGVRVARGVRIHDFGWATTNDTIKQWTVRNCIFDTISPGAEGDCLSVSTDSSGMVESGGRVEACEFRNFGRRAGKIIGSGTVWVGNYAESYDTNAYSGFSSYGNNNIFEGNTILGTMSIGIEFGSASVSTIGGNAIGNNISFDSSVASVAEGIKMTQSAKSITTSGNGVSNAKFHTRLEGAIDNCLVIGARGTNITSNAIQFSTLSGSSPLNCSVYGIQIDNCAAYGVRVDAGTNITVAGVGGTFVNGAVYYNAAVTGISSPLNGSMRVKQVSKSGNYTLTTSDHYVTFSANATATLPAAALATMGTGADMSQVYIIKSASGVTTTLARTGSDTIEGATSDSLTSLQAAAYVSDGVSNWRKFSFGGGGTVPTGTGFTHITSGAQDAASKKVALNDTADVTGTLPIGNGGTGQTTASAAFDALAPTTTRGDLITRGASSNGRLALGVSSSRLFSDGTDAVWNSPGSTFFWEDDMIPFNTTSSIRWNSENIVSAVSTAAQNVGWPRFGVWRLTTAATAASGGVFRASDSGGPNWGTIEILSGNAGWDSTFIFRVNPAAGTTNDCRVRVGFMSKVAAAADPAAWMGVRYDMTSGIADTTFRFCTRLSSSYGIQTDSGIAADTAWHRLRIRSTVAGTVAMSLDGGSETSTSSQVPNVTLIPFFQIVSDANVAKTLDIDYFCFYASGLSR